MGLLKRITASDRLRGLLCWLAAQYVTLVWRTGKWEVVGGDIPARHWNAGRPFILSFWHGRLLMMPYIWRRGTPIHMLVSHHRDGQMIGRMGSHFGVGSIAGSSSRGGAAGLKAMVRMLKAGECVGITPDGPRGPRMRAAAGIITLARLSGAPIIPATFSTARRRMLGSWDRFLVPLPFSRGIFVWGRPIEVPRDASEAATEALRQELEDRLNAITAAADSRMGHPAVEPAPWPQSEVPVPTDLPP